MSASILVVDDEGGVNDLICDALRLAGHEPVSARDGVEGLQALRETPVDLVVLDVNMPKMDGFTVLTRMRAAGDATPVIFLTARQGPDDIRAGFELGADDFVRKPFGIEELALRVNAVLRRTNPDPVLSQVQVGALCLDGRGRRVTCNGSLVDLSATEFRLLQVLMEGSGEVLSKDFLLRRIWGLDGSAETTVVETYVSYLRRKLGEHVTIRTVRGFGYELVGERVRS
jgi:two-component system OmpR family response regulator